MILPAKAGGARRDVPRLREPLVLELNIKVITGGRRQHVGNRGARRKLKMSCVVERCPANERGEIVFRRIERDREGHEVREGAKIVQPVELARRNESREAMLGGAALAGPLEKQAVEFLIKL